MISHDLFRLPDDSAIINRMGFNNDGVKEWQNEFETSQQPFLKAKENHDYRWKHWKNKDTPNEGAWKDYEICFNELFDCVDYFVVNVSSPNTPGLRELQEKSSLLKILGNLQLVNNAKLYPKPITFKNCSRS